MSSQALHSKLIQAELHRARWASQTQPLKGAPGPWRRVYAEARSGRGPRAAGRGPWAGCRRGQAAVAARFAAARADGCLPHRMLKFYKPDVTRLAATDVRPIGCFSETDVTRLAVMDAPHRMLPFQKPDVTRL